MCVCLYIYIYKYIKKPPIHLLFSLHNVSLMRTQKKYTIEVCLFFYTY